MASVIVARESGTAQTVATASATVVTYDADKVDTDGFTASAGATPTVPAGLGGRYIIWCCMQLVTNPSAVVGVLEVRLRVGTTVVASRRIRHAVAGASTYVLTVSALYELAATNTVDVQIYHETTELVTLTIVASMAPRLGLALVD